MTPFLVWLTVIGLAKVVVGSAMFLLRRSARTDTVHVGDMEHRRPLPTPEVTR